jgi:hypothetical protein
VVACFVVQSAIPVALSTDLMAAWPFRIRQMLSRVLRFGRGRRPRRTNGQRSRSARRAVLRGRVAAAVHQALEDFGAETVFSWPAASNSPATSEVAGGRRSPAPAHATNSSGA